MLIMNRLFSITVFLLLLSAVCWAGGNKETDTKPAPQAQRQQVNTQPRQQTPPTSKYWTGDGGKGMSLTITVPKPNGFAENQKHLPLMVHNEFITNFKNYSAIDVLDWERLGAQYDIILSGYFDDKAETGLDLGHLPTTTHQMGGNITRTATGYALQMQITRTEDKMTIASYSGTFSFAELDNLTSIRRASLDLLQKMGITLTALAQGELTKAETENRVNAQTALARGITVQRQGTEVAALSYFYQANSFDSSLAEAASRLNILSASISSGDIGADTRNDIAWRKQWVERLQEAESFFANYVKEQPYNLVYSTEIKQGDINYQNETVNLTFWMGLVPDFRWLRTINEVLLTVETGLLATGRAATWGLDWPNKSIRTPSSFTDRTNNYVVLVEIINDQGRSIGKQTITMPSGYTFFTIDNIKTGSLIARQWRGDVTIPRVDVNAITDRLTIRVISIDGISAETASLQKKISILPLEEITKSPDWSNGDESLFIVRDDGTLTGYTGNQTHIVIPSTIRGMVITSISYGSFSYNKQVTSVTIPSSVITIKDSAFTNCDRLTNVIISNGVRVIGERVFTLSKITSVIIPSSVKVIGTRAFSHTGLVSITIPNGVITIGAEAFYLTSLTSITIPNSVKSMGRSMVSSSLSRITIPGNMDNVGDSIGPGFDLAYWDQKRAAGTYTRNGNTWTYTP